MVVTILDHNNKELYQQAKDNSNKNENGKKTIGLYWHNNNVECASRFFSSNMELPNFMRPLYGVGEHNTKNFFS